MTASPPAEAFAVFLRAANVAGHQVFKPSAVARTLAPFGARSIGAAGTFVFLKAPGEKRLRGAIEKAVPFKPQMAVVGAREVRALLDSRPFGAGAPAAGEKRYAVALVEKPKRLPRFPVDRPEGGPWQLRLAAVSGSFALCLRRAKEPGKFYPNDLVEEVLGVPSTTRGWSTMEAVGRALAE